MSWEFNDDSENEMTKKELWDKIYGLNRKQKWLKLDPHKIFSFKRPRFDFYRLGFEIVLEDKTVKFSYFLLNSVDPFARVD